MVHDLFGLAFARDPAQSVPGRVLPYLMGGLDEEEEGGGRLSNKCCQQLCGRHGAIRYLSKAPSGCTGNQWFVS